jgi:hypothetical protein
MPLMKLDAAGGMRRPSRADMRPRKWQVIGRGAYVHNWEICTGFVRAKRGGNPVFLHSRKSIEQRFRGTITDRYLMRSPYAKVLASLAPVLSASA